MGMRGEDGEGGWGREGVGEWFEREGGGVEGVWWRHRPPANDRPLELSCQVEQTFLDSGRSPGRGGWGGRVGDTARSAVDVFRRCSCQLVAVAPDIGYGAGHWLGRRLICWWGQV